MPSQKGLEQALTWLKSKMAEKDTLDAINAEVAYHVILDLREKRRVIGALYHNTYAASKKAQEKLQELELDRFMECAERQFGYMPKDLTEEEIQHIFEKAGDGQ